jgi:hypothetical protein
MPARGRRANLVIVGLTLVEMRSTVKKQSAQVAVLDEFSAAKRRQCVRGGVNGTGNARRRAQRPTALPEDAGGLAMEPEPRLGRFARRGKCATACYV